MRFLLGLALFFLLAGGLGDAEVVKFRDMQRLPAGEAITLQGSLGDIPVALAGGSQSDPAMKGKFLADFIDANALKLTYRVAGLQARESTGTVADGQWSVSLDPLPENGAVTLSLAFSGHAASAIVKGAVEQVISGGDYGKLYANLLTTFSSPSTPEDRQKLVAAFLQQTASLIADALPAFVHAQPERADRPVIGTLSSLPQWIQEMRVALEGKSVEGLSNLGAPGSSVTAAAIAELRGYHPPLAPPAGVDAPAWEDFKDAHTRFLTGYALVASEFSRILAATITASAQVTATSGVKDFEKYAGVDLGVAWIPGIEDFRSFVTINVYLGPVEERPFVHGGFWETLRQTISLTAGYAFADISGSDPQKSLYKNNNAFLAGVGVRLNKYFRVLGGTAIYRRELLTAPAAGTVADSLQGRLRTAAFVGASIDVTALPNLRALFGKAGTQPAAPVSVPVAPAPATPPAPPAGPNP